MQANDISWISLALGSLILIFPILIFQYYKTGLVKSMLTGYGRMVLQLAFVGIYMQYIFSINSILINLAWVTLMLIAATFSIIRRSEIKEKKFIIPVISGLLSDIFINILIYSFIIMNYTEFFNARYLIPITGMVIGNCISNSIIGIRTFYNSLLKDELKYRYSLISGANHKEALMPFMSEALKISFAPTIASNATIGLIWLPGMMTGQILGGSDPLTAIKYQIMIVLSIFVGGVLTVFISLYLSSKYAFDKNYNLNKQIFKSISSS